MTDDLIARLRAMTWESFEDAPNASEQACREAADALERNLTDPQRMLWRDDVDGICPTPDLCWEYGDTARCGPCAIKQAGQLGVESNYSVPNLPEVYRLQRELKALRERADELADAADNVITQRGSHASRSILRRRLTAYRTAFPEPRHD